MPSPGISFGDLMVFIAVLIIMAVFLAALRSFIKRGETPDPPPEPQRRRLEGSRAEKSRATAPQHVTSSQSASR